VGVRPVNSNPTFQQKLGNCALPLFWKVNTYVLSGWQASSTATGERELCVLAEGFPQGTGGAVGALDLGLEWFCGDSGPERCFSRCSLG